MKLFKVSSIIIQAKINMKIVFCSLVVMFLFSCGQDKTKNSNHNKEVKSYVEKEQSSSTESTVEMLFLGHYIRCLRQDLPLEFARICREDDNLSYDSINQNVTIYGTTFHINYLQSNHGFFLITSVQPDTKQIKKVREAISKFHGEENFEEDMHYSWLPFTDSTKRDKPYPVIHLRRIRSEEGGTAIIVF